MISEAIEQYAEGGLVSHCWTICAVRHGHGALSGGRDGGGG